MGMGVRLALRGGTTTYSFCLVVFWQKVGLFSHNKSPPSAKLLTAKIAKCNFWPTF